MDNIEVLCPSRRVGCVALMTKRINTISGADTSDSVAIVVPFSQPVVIFEFSPSFLMFNHPGFLEHSYFLPHPLKLKLPLQVIYNSAEGV